MLKFWCRNSYYTFQTSVKFLKLEYRKFSGESSIIKKMSETNCNFHVK